MGFDFVLKSRPCFKTHGAPSRAAEAEIRGQKQRTGRNQRTGLWGDRAWQRVPGEP